MRLFSCLSLLSVAIPLAVAALDQTQMSAHLAAAVHLLGTFETSTSNTSNWMSSISDSQPIQALSIPGTHDTLTCECRYAATVLAWPQDVTALTDNCTWGILGNVSGLAASFTKTQVSPARAPQKSAKAHVHI
jgi:hypothetical protein